MEVEKKNASKNEKEVTTANNKGGLDSTEVEWPQTALKLISKEGKEIVIPNRSHLCKLSVMAGKALENDANVDVFPVKQITSEVLGEIVTYLSHHKGTVVAPIDKPLRSKCMRDVVKDQWDAVFIDRVGENRELLYALILAANYLDIPSLLQLGCAKVASLIKGQPLEKIKEILEPKLHQQGEKKCETV